MGQRNTNFAFMPNKFVFPGGSVEAQDHTVPVAGILDAIVEEKLISGTPKITTARARTLALTAIRETYEETGLMLGTRDYGAPSKAQDALEAKNTWQAFAAEGIMPELETMQFVARAVTPPKHIRRFDTRFFTINAAQIAHHAPHKIDVNSEFSKLHWVSFNEAKELDIAAITHVVLEELENRIAAGAYNRHPVPFYFERGGKFVREEV
jgi:8-oxo-dGTP pyrophosphatase MutT (NUDIX family)